MDKNVPERRGIAAPPLETSSPRKTTGDKHARITISRADLDNASKEGLIPSDSVGALWDSLSRRTVEGPRFDFSNLLWYGGASVIILAMGWFLFLIAVQSDPTLLLITSVIYAGAFLYGGLKLSQKKDLRVPGGLLVTLATIMTPVIGLALFSLAGVNNFDTGHQLALEVATIAACLAALRWVKFPFITLPAYASLWAMSFTAVHAFTDSATYWSYHQDLGMSMVLGGAITFLAYLIDRRTDEDYSYWGYFFGGTLLWGSWTLLAFDRPEHLMLGAYLVSNLAFLVASVALQRGIFALAGGLGVTAYLTYIAFDIFDGSMAFPIALTAIGAGVIYAGVKYHKHQQTLESMFSRSFKGKR